MHTLTPHIWFGTRGAEAIDFSQRAFGAELVGEAVKGGDGKSRHARHDCWVIATHNRDLTPEEIAKSQDRVHGLDERLVPTECYSSYPRLLVAHPGDSTDLELELCCGAMPGWVGIEHHAALCTVPRSFCDTRSSFGYCPR